MTLNPFLISILAAVAATSFFLNRAMSRYIRIPMMVILLYFSFLYWLIGADKPDLIDKALMVRIGMFFLFTNISIGNYTWFLFLRKNQAKYGRRWYDESRKKHE
jgi:hypothetical protein